MDRSLLWGAFTLGIAGWIFGALLRLRGSAEPGAVQREAPVYAAAAAGLVVLVFLITLPSQPPFAAGQGFGHGFALGGLGALLASWAVRRRPGAAVDILESVASLVAPWFMAVSVTALALLTLWQNSMDALLGVAIAWLAVSALLGLERGTEDASPPATRMPILNAGVYFTVWICAAAGLGVYRGQTSLDHLRWSAAVLCTGAAIPLALIAAALPESLLFRYALRLPFAGTIARLAGKLSGTDAARRVSARAWRNLLSICLFLAAGWLIGSRLATEPHVFHAALIGIATGLLAWWLAVDAARDTADGAGRRALALLAILGGSMAAYQMLAGAGVALAAGGFMMIAGLAVSPIPADSTRSTVAEDAGGSVREAAARTVTTLLVFSVITVLYRLLTTRYQDDLRGAAITDQYGLFGLILGFILPVLSAELQSRGLRAPQKAWAQIATLALAGVLLLAGPALTVLLYGSKCVLALVLGLALSAALTATQSRSQEPDRAAAPGSPRRRLADDSRGIFAVAAALAATQWMRHALPLASLSRAHKIDVVAGACALLIVAILAADYGARLLRPAGVAPEGEVAR